MTRLMVVFAVLAVTACGNLPPSFHTVRSGPDTLITSSYRATDQILKLAGNRINPSEPVIVATLADVNNLETSSPLGRLVAEQMASRLVNTGYTVVEVKLREGLLVRKGLGQLALSRDALQISHAQGAQAVLAGTYTAAAKDVYVNIKLIRAVDGRVVAAHDYVIALDSDAQQLLKDKGRWIVTR